MMTMLIDLMGDDVTVYFNWEVIVVNILIDHLNLSRQCELSIFLNKLSSI